MFGLSFEKLLLVAVIAAFVVGPHRLPLYAAKLGRFVRAVRGVMDSARQRAEADLGMPLDRSSWQVDLRQYDPRKIVRDALDHPAAPTPPSAPAEPARPSPDAPPDAAPDVAVDAAPDAPPDAAPDVAVEPAPGSAEPAPEGAGDRPVPLVTRQRWVVAGGTSGHPRRVLVTETVPADQTGAGVAAS